MLPIDGQVLETRAAGSGAIPRRHTVGGPLWRHAHRWPTTNQDRKYRRTDGSRIDPRYFMAPPRPQGLTARPTALEVMACTGPGAMA